MSKFVRKIVITEEFEGDNVTFTLLPMKTADALKFTDDSQFQDKDMIEVFGSYIEKVEGLKDAAQADITKEELLLHGHFIGLAVAVAMKWIEQSLPSKAPGKPEPSAK